MESRVFYTKPEQITSFVNSLIFRIDGHYFDLTHFVDEHPGGADILHFAKRKSWDSTQLFSIHHVNYTKASSIMNRYLITDDALIDRITDLEAIEVPKYFPKQLPDSSSPYYPTKLRGSGIESYYANNAVTHHASDPSNPKNKIESDFNWVDLRMANCVFELPVKGSFYWELREEIFKYFKKHSLSYHPSDNYMHFWWFVVTLSILLQLSQYFYPSYVTAILTGFTYLILGGYGHQFIHIPAFRQHAYIGLDWIGLYSYAYMVDHVVLHHIFTNTIPDNHLDGTDPFLFCNPFTPREWWRKTFKFLLTNLTVACGIYGNYVNNWVLIVQGKERLYPCIFLFPLSYIVMCLLVNDWWLGIKLSMLSTVTVSTWYFSIALMNHNQSENWDLDKLKKAARCAEKGGGWAEMQLVTSSDIGYDYGFFGSMLCLWLNYHTVHHLLPCVDMSHHREAQRILNRVSAKHGISYSYKSIWTMYWDMLDTFSVPRAINAMLEKE